MFTIKNEKEMSVSSLCGGKNIDLMNHNTHVNYLNYLQLHPNFSTS